MQDSNPEMALASKTHKSSVVELDKKCFSCCGFPASSLTAFKMACLAYNPSSIKINSK